MNTVVLLVLTGYLAICQGITIRLPVMTSPISGFFPPSSSWGNCDSEQRPFQGTMDSNKECSISKLKSVCNFNDNHANMLLTYAMDVGPRHPMARGPRVGADAGAKKCMCKVASECGCQLAKDWCSNRNLKKHKKVQKKKKEEEEEEEADQKSETENEESEKKKKNEDSSDDE